MNSFNSSPQLGQVCFLLVPLYASTKTPSNFVNLHQKYCPSRTVVKSIEVFYGVESVVTHYSTAPLTTGPDYDPLLLLLALAGDVHPNPGPSRYPCSACFKNVTSQGTSYLCTRCSHWVHLSCSGLRNAAYYRKANGWICTACMTPPRPRAPSPPPSPVHHVRQVVQHTTVERQWYRQQTDGTKHLPRGAQRQSGVISPSSRQNREVQTSRTTPK